MGPSGYWERFTRLKAGFTTRMTPDIKHLVLTHTHMQRLTHRRTHSNAHAHTETHTHTHLDTNNYSFFFLLIYDHLYFFIDVFISFYVLLLSLVSFYSRCNVCCQLLSLHLSIPLSGPPPLHSRFHFPSLPRSSVGPG